MFLMTLFPIRTNFVSVFSAPKTILRSVDYEKRRANYPGRRWKWELKWRKQRVRGFTKTEAFLFAMGRQKKKKFSKKRLGQLSEGGETFLELNSGLFLSVTQPGRQCRPRENSFLKRYLPVYGHIPVSSLRRFWERAGLANRRMRDGKKVIFAFQPCSSLSSFCPQELMLNSIG